MNDASVLPYRRLRVGSPGWLVFPSLAVMLTVGIPGLTAAQTGSECDDDDCAALEAAPLRAARLPIARKAVADDEAQPGSVEIAEPASFVSAVASVAPVGKIAIAPALAFNFWDPNSVPWASLSDYTSAGFANKFDALKVDMLPINVDVSVIDGNYRVGAAFQKNVDKRGWVSLRDLTANQFATKITQYKNANYRMIDQGSYTLQGQQRYSAIWVKNVENLANTNYHDVTAQQFSQLFDVYRAQGLMPIDMQVYPTANGMRYSAVWMKSNLGWKLLHGLTSAQFSTAFDAAKAADQRSIRVGSVQTSGGQRYWGIWVDNPNGRYWAEYRDMTANGFHNRWNLMRDLGYREIQFTKYATASGPRYAAVWRQNDDRPDWPLRVAVNELVEDELDAFDVPGMSVVIAHDGRFVYTRGFGHADIDDNVWMHSRSVHRLASVSKAVTGVLAELLFAKYPGLDLTDKIRDHVPQLPAFHDYTIEQQLQHRSCVAHYPTGFSTQETDHYATALDAVLEFMNQPLVCVPPAYLYSTAGFTVAASAFEAVVGEPIRDIFIDELNAPFKLGTLRPENLDVDVANRVTFYTTDNDEYAGDDTSWKIPGGGLESSAFDLVRLGRDVLNGTILNQTQRDELWKSGAGLGWSTTTASNGAKCVGKSGGQPGAKSYLRIYPDDGIVIAVLANRWGGGHSASALSEAIGELMLAELP